MAEHPSAPNPPEPIAQPDGDVSTEAVTPTERPERAGAPGAATAQREPLYSENPLQIAKLSRSPVKARTPAPRTKSSR